MIPKNEALEPAIRRGRIEALTIYEVSESELEALERGTPATLFLNFSVFLLSVGLSFLISLVTTTIISVRMFTAFVVVTAVSLVVGSVLLALWYRGHVSLTEIGRRIRRRVPPEGIPAINEGETGWGVVPSTAAPADQKASVSGR
jgi:hypothetical protein